MSYYYSNLGNVIGLKNKLRVREELIKKLYLKQELSEDEIKLCEVIII